jgi:hypothetical protein
MTAHATMADLEFDSMLFSQDPGAETHSEDSDVDAQEPAGHSSDDELEGIHIIGAALNMRWPGAS